MALTKIIFVNEETVIDADFLNNLQDAVIILQGDVLGVQGDVISLQGTVGELQSTVDVLKNKSTPTWSDIGTKKGELVEAKAATTYELNGGSDGGIWYKNLSGTQITLPGTDVVITLNNEYEYQTTVAGVSNWFVEIPDGDGVFLISQSVVDGLSIEAPNNSSFVDENGQVTIAISAYETVVEQVPWEYLPLTFEEWTFTLEDGSTVTKAVCAE